MDRRDNLGIDGGAAAGPGRAFTASRSSGQGHARGLGVASVQPVSASRQAEAVSRIDAKVSPAFQPAPAEPPQSAAPPDAPAPRKPGRKRLVGGIALAVLGGAIGYYGYNWWTVGRFEVWTDNAYVRADITILAAKASGYITDVRVSNNQAVKAGDVIARIDDGDYQIAVRSARGKVATQQATVARIVEQTKAAQASVEQARAQIPASEADVVRARAELDRQNKLAAHDFASMQKLELARADSARAAAALKGAQAALVAAQANVAVFDAQRTEAERTLEEYQTAVAKAERDLSFTVMRAPIDGVIGNKAVQVGQFMQPGTRLAALVPLGATFVDANFKETQLAGLKPGQPVDITVDAYPGRHFPATVESMSPASGALFSLLPPDNATGNFTKIIQRIPVRVRLAPEVVAEQVLRPGMSVTATVSLKNGATAEEAKGTVTTSHR